VLVKTVFAVAVFVVAGCAAPKNATNDPLGGSSPDLSSDGTGGNGAEDMALGGGGAAGGGGGGGGSAGGGGGGGGTVVQDLAMPADMAQPIQDMAQPIPPDMAQPLCSPPSGSACVVYPQCGCSASQSCDITTASGAGVCVAVGTTPNWNNCTMSGQCMKGSTCVHGVCTPFCATTGVPSADCSSGTAECYQLQDTNANNIPNDKVCSQNCDPTNPTSTAAGFSPCGPNVNCWPDADHYAWCLGPTKATGTQGADCTNTAGTATDPTKCAPGYYCNVGTLSGTCYKMCHVALTGECPTSTTCKSFSTKMYAGSAEIGVCH
jgi:hypothetical protein